MTVLKTVGNVTVINWSTSVISRDPTVTAWLTAKGYKISSI